MHLAGFDKLIEEGKVDADSFDVSVVTAKVPRDEEGNEIEVMPSEEDIVTLDPEIIKNKTIEENNKLIITLDGTKIPHEVGEEENAFEVERISLNVTATRSDVDTSIFDEGKVVLYEDEGIGRPVFVTWTCATLGHDWSEPLYTWAEDYSSVTAGHYCMRDTHAPIVYLEEETVETTSVSEGASCTVPGTITYTATFTKEGFETQTMQVEGGTLPHEWDEASYEWAEGDGSVTASHVCAVCGTEESESVETISEVKGTPDCEHGTVTTYTAAFTKPGFETQTKDVENDDALGHDWGEPEYTWADDNSSVTATIACGRDSSHNKTETVDTTSEQTLDPTCEEMGETTYTASFESDLFTTQTRTVENIDALNHDWGEITYSPTETEFDPDVHKTVTASRACTRDDCDGTVTETVTITSESDAASCTDPGKVTYTATFTKPEFSEAEWETEREVGAVGHSWGIPTYTWAEDHSTATATAICSRCQDETSETVNTTSEQTSDPTCEEMGETTYTATFTDSLFTTQTDTVADIKALGHDWEFKSLVWSGNDKDGYTAVANYECKRNSEHKDSVNATITKEETVKATCEASGKTTYTAAVTASASLDNTAHEDTKEVTVPALGHKWEFVDFTWSGNDKDGYTAVANYKCSNDASHKQTVNAVVDGGTVQTPASCETTGVKVYTATIDATASLDDQAHSGTKNVDIAALGHDWEFVDFTWSGNEKDGYTAIANYKCKNNTSHKQTVNAVVDGGILQTPATCETSGVKVYTATIAVGDALDGVARTDEKETTLPALGHDWEFKGFTLSGDAEHGFTAVANYECKNNASHKDTVTAIVNGGVVQKDATCEQEGIKVFTVTVNASSSLDGEIHEKTENASIPPLGHKWDDGTITTRATDTADGWMAYKCTRQGCNGTKSEKIPAHESPVSAINRNISDAETAIEAGKIAEAEEKANAVKTDADAAVTQARTAFNNAKASGNAEAISAARQDLIDAIAAQSRAEATVARAEAKKAAADAEAKKAAAASAAAGTQAAVDAAQAAVTAANTAKTKAETAKAAAERAVAAAAATGDDAVKNAANNALTKAGTDVSKATTAVTNANTALNSAKQAKQTADKKKAEEAAKPKTKPEVVDLKAVKGLKVKGAKKKLTVKWKKAKKKELNTFQGYEIQYTLDGTFKDYPAKKVGKKKASATLKKLLKKKKYKVRIRRYRDDGKVLHVSPWKMKKGKTK